MCENPLVVELAHRDEPHRPDGGVYPIGQVLAELLKQYQVRFPDLKMTILEEPAAAA